ncbi:MAG: peptidoglycan-binding protein [Clostridia bacterium]|nr:peptidoglycan-binding protein [Clostridia bacterium]
MKKFALKLVALVLTLITAVSISIATPTPAHAAGGTIVSQAEISAEASTEGIATSSNANCSLKNTSADDTVYCSKAKVSTILFQSGERGRWTPAYAEPPLGTVLNTSSPRSNYVRWLQACLNHFGYNAGTVDGWYGANTKNAVRSFQRDRGIAVDGVFGTQTHIQIRVMLGKPVENVWRVIARNGLNVRVNPSTSSSILGALRYGAYVSTDVYRLFENGDYWACIQYQGRSGWIKLGNIKTNTWYANPA